MSPRYRPMPGGPWFPLAVFGIFGLATVSMALSMVSGGGPLLHWRAALRSGAVALSEIEEIRPMRMASNVEVIVVRNQRPIMTVATSGIREFNDSILHQRPDLSVRLGWNARLDERLSFGSRSRFR